MALTPTEEAQVLALIAQEAALLSLASEEPAIISNLGATDVSLSDLTAASSLGSTDLLLVRQGVTDKSITGALIATASTPASASETVQGIVELATAAETVTGTDNTRAVHPAGLASALSAIPQSPGTRQTVVSGPVDSSGFASFGGTTGTTTVTLSGTLKVTCFAGGDLNYVGSTTNPAWTGLNAASTTYYRYTEITSLGVVTTGISTLEWVYQWSGTPSVTNGQHTVNVQEGKVYCGNGTTAPQVYRVLVGESATNGSSVVSSNTDYAIQRRYRSVNAAMPSGSTNTNLNHNLGVKFGLAHKFMGINTTTELGYAVGDYNGMVAQASSACAMDPISITGRNTCNITSGNSGNPWIVPSRSATIGSAGAITLANWNYFVEIWSIW